MSREDGRVISPPEKLYSIGPDVAGIIGKNGVAFEILEMGSDILVSIGEFGHAGWVGKESGVLFDLPSPIGGGGIHPHTLCALSLLRETISNYSQKPLSPGEKIIERYFRAELVDLRGNRLELTFSRDILAGLFIDAYSADGEKRVYFSLFEGQESQTKFAGIINAFKRLAEAIQKDNQSPWLNYTGSHTSENS